MPERIQRKRTKGWRIPAGAVNVSRGTDWGNPFRIGDTITYTTNAGYTIALTIDRSLTIELYRAWIWERRWISQIQQELAGKDLICWCPTWAPCHGDVLLEVANA